ncbi:sterol desaturase family protein [Singulisphaera sp. Ch08]|uniref:Sterol desaturase family protein n=1 Tax=Singulisphaera sp. Ch08 TaxID=3120278 RepID=A0AAU7CAS9_9BACT
MNDFLDWAHDLSPVAAAAWLFGANLVSFAFAVALGHLALFSFSGNRVSLPPDPLEPKELVYTAAGIVVNWLITIAAWLLWRHGFVVIRRDTGWRAWLDVPILVLVMDLAMYLLHRVVHHPWLFPIHRLHHDYDRPRPLSLFVLNPLETLGFGTLWLIVIVLYPSSWLGLSTYLGINLGTGMMGHLGVEPFPGWWSRVPVLRQVGTSTFHAQHHQDVHHNFGFYTLIWDRLFGTLLPTYDAEFGHTLPVPPTAASHKV